jgi:hypothetical protein
MIVTTNIIITERPSTNVPTVTLKSPSCHHVTPVSTGVTACSSPVPTLCAAFTCMIQLTPATQA